MERKVKQLRLWGSGTRCSLWIRAHMSLFHEELKVLRHPGGQWLSHQLQLVRVGRASLFHCLGIVFHGEC